ncbi:MAG: outer membrane lipoprotein-sorting protein [Proteobacteria bacterium]|jgi:hypothetical protein|nr:outer membrane lipoprotein-sorting protein [Pseudomonadota bacterium]
MFFPLMLVLSGLPALADDIGEEALKRVDAALTAADEQVFHYELMTETPGMKPRAMEISVSMKGAKTLTEFHSPADLSGTKVLSLSRNQMYIYLPAYQKVRRIGSHVTGQGFMGTTYSHAEMSILEYSSSYTASLLEETEAQWTIELLPRPEVKVAHPRMEMVIMKEMAQPTEIRYFNTKGANTKTEVRREFTCEGKVCNPEVMRMTDHTRNGAWTEFRRQKWEAQPGLDEGLFTVRSLQSGS